MSEREDVEGLIDVENVERNMTMMRTMMGDPRARATVDDALTAIRTLREQVEREHLRAEEAEYVAREPLAAMQNVQEQHDAQLDAMQEQVERLRGERDADREHFREQIRDISRGAQAGAITVAARRWVQDHLKVQDNDIPADFEGFVLRMVERAEAAEARVAELEADRERLDWLEANAEETIRLHGGWDIWTHEGTEHEGDTLREAIDAARRALTTEGGE